VLAHERLLVVERARERFREPYVLRRQWGGMRAEAGVFAGLGACSA